MTEKQSNNHESECVLTNKCTMKGIEEHLTT